MKEIFNFFINLPRPFKRIIIFLFDIIIAVSSVYLAYVARFEDLYFFDDRDIKYLVHDIDYFFIICFYLFVFYFFKIYKTSARYFIIDKKKQIYYLIAIVLYFLTVSIYFNLSNQIYSQSVVVFQPVIFILLFYLSRSILLKINNKNQNINKKEKILLIGEEEALYQLIQNINLFKYDIIGFYDVVTNNFNIKGIKKISSLKNLKELTDQHQVREVFIGYSSKNLKNVTLKKILKTSNFNFTIYPLTDGVLNLNHMRKINNRLINIDKILEKKTYDYSKIYEHFFNEKTILITGGAGSIGKAILNQLVKTNYKKIIIIDSSEISIFNLKNHIKYNLEYKELTKKLYYYLGSVSSEKIINEIFKNHQVDFVYHAAAYKHVDLAQQNISSLINNNIFGTETILKLSKKYKIKNFVFISSDKAVNPAGIMGITKKIGEYLVKYYLDKSETHYSIVRFGNVLNSSGSIIPLFLNQIKTGGPITITDLEVTRYFMSSVMAAQLVLISTTIYKLGKIFIFDMGKPFKIVDLAKRLIRFYEDENNLPPQNIKLKIIGLKEGEKLHEELSLGENLEKTKYKKILIAREKELDFEKIEKIIFKIKDLYKVADDSEIKNFLLNNTNIK
jgi:FlaA1/EpsC-like NDP-sugar epimerase